MDTLKSVGGTNGVNLQRRREMVHQSKECLKSYRESLAPGINSCTSIFIDTTKLGLVIFATFDQNILKMKQFENTLVYAALR